jgi:ABC-2 type transport system permease protein
MLRGLWKLTWLEIKIFLREPMGAFGSIILPVLVFVVVGRVTGGRIMPTPGSTAARGAFAFLGAGLPVFVAILIALSGVTSLVTIISIYREGGILKRLRATPVRPLTILTAHVLVKLLRFAQPLGTAILYPMIGVSGLFVPVHSLPPMLQTVARVTPLTYAVSLLQGIWKGEPWSAHWSDIVALVAVFVICSALAAKVFRWE